LMKLCRKSQGPVFLDTVYDNFDFMAEGR